MSGAVPDREALRLARIRRNKARASMKRAETNLRMQKFWLEAAHRRVFEAYSDLIAAQSEVDLLSIGGNASLRPLAEQPTPAEGQRERGEHDGEG